MRDAHLKSKQMISKDNGQDEDILRRCAQDASEVSALSVSFRRRLLQKLAQIFHRAFLFYRSSSEHNRSVLIKRVVSFRTRRVRPMPPCGPTRPFKVSALRFEQKVCRRFVGNNLNVGAACSGKILQQVSRRRCRSRLQSDFDGLVLRGDRLVLRRDRLVWRRGERVLRRNGSRDRERAKQCDQNSLQQGEPPVIAGGLYHAPRKLGSANPAKLRFTLSSRSP